MTTLPSSCAIVTKSGNLNFLEPSGSVQARNGTALPFTSPHKRAVILHTIKSIDIFVLCSNVPPSSIICAQFLLPFVMCVLVCDCFMCVTYLPSFSSPIIFVFTRMQDVSNLIRPTKKKKHICQGKMYLCKSRTTPQK